MIDLGGTATGCVDTVAGLVGSLRGSAAFAGGVGVRDSVNGLFGAPKGFATLELDGATPPTLTTPTVLSIVMLGDSTSNTSNLGEIDEWIFRLFRLWMLRYPVSFAYAWSFNADDPFGTGFRSLGVTRLDASSTQLVQVWNPSKGGLSFNDINGYADDTLLNDYVVDRHPDILVIAMGINQQFDPDLGSDMQTFIDDVEAAVPAVSGVVSSENPTAAAAGAPTVRDTVRAVAAANGYLFVDAFQAFIAYGDWESLLSDGVHPTPEGSQLWADTFNTSTFLTATGELVGTGDMTVNCTIPSPAVACSTANLDLACTISA